MILLDVSETALGIAQATYAQIPVIGDRPEPGFLRFDGRRIELPDRSVDRVLCFDAFHHAPNPQDVLKELGRILVPGGIAGFAEPGPTHSQTAQSQFEMRTYGVLENDIDLPVLWRLAQQYGFSDLKVAAFNIPPFHVPLGEFQDLLDGGATYSRWADRTREFLRDVRNFFLIKGGTPIADSRHAEGLRAAISVSLEPGPSAGSRRFRAAITNIGSSRWLPSRSGAGGVWLGCHLYDQQGGLLNFELARYEIGDAVDVDQTVEVSGDLPQLPAAAHRIEFDCVSADVTWFTQLGSQTSSIEVVVDSR